MVWGWASTSPGRSSSCTAARSMSRARSARARPSGSPCRCCRPSSASAPAALAHVALSLSCAPTRGGGRTLVLAKRQRSIGSSLRCSDDPATIINVRHAKALHRDAYPTDKELEPGPPTHDLPQRQEGGDRRQHVAAGGGYRIREDDVHLRLAEREPEHSEAQ